MGKEIKHADPDAYTADLKAALDAFEKALISRYKDDLDDHLQVWTPHGEEPDPRPTASAGPGPDTVSLGYDHAKKSAPAWAAEVRADVEPGVPIYDAQDLNKVESAFDDLVSTQKLLGGQSAVGEDGTIPDLTNKINGRSGKADEFTAWAGVSGDNFKNNFGQYVDPTMENQTAIARSLANLYAGRACIVDSARGNSLAAIKRATEKLGATVDSGVEEARWTVVGVGSIAVGLASTGAGTVIAIAGMLGAYLDNKNPDQEYANDIESVVLGLKADLRRVADDLRGEENKWSGKVEKLQTAIAGEASKNLELYDFSGSEAGSSSPPAGGFDVDVDYVNKLAKLCFRASDEYERVIKKALATEDADAELKGSYNVTTTGDTELKETRNALVSFLQTTCARYYEAGSRLNDAARMYYGIEAENEAVMKYLEEDPDLNGADRPGKGGSVNKHIKETNRDNIEDGDEPEYERRPGGRIPI